MNRLSLLLIFVFTLIFAGCGTNNPDVINGKYEIIGGSDSIEMNKESWSVTFEGKMKNLTGKELTACKITISVYDIDGVQLGTAVDRITYMDIDGVWAFKAEYFGDPESVASFRVSEIWSVPKR